MFIGHSNIEDLLKVYGSSSHINAPDYCITSCVPVRNAVLPYSLHQLYAVTPEDSLDLNQLIPSINLLMIGFTDETAAQKLGDKETQTNYTVINSPVSDKIRYDLREFFNEKNAMSLVAESILDILFHENTIQSMVDKFTRGFNNPVFVFDAGFHLIACNYEMAVQHPSGISIVNNMGMTADEYRIINKRRIHEKVKKSDVPIRVFHEEIGCEQLICSIDTRKDMGHIVINAINRPFNNVDYKLLLMLKEGIYQQMRKIEFVNDNNGYPYEYFLKDLLDGKIATPKQYLQRMSYVNSEFTRSLYCLVIETARSSGELNKFLVRSRFESLLPNTKTLMYNGEIIVLFCLPDGEELNSGLLKKIHQLCLEFGLYSGLSNNFSDLLEVSGYYKQALRSIELGVVDHPDPGLFIYNDYYMEHMAHIFFQKENPEIYCHPKMKILMEYDRTHDSQLSNSLYSYLLHERNAASTAEAMGIHRNTLNYRLTKIDSLVKIDFENASERQYLILSYEFHKKISH